MCAMALVTQAIGVNTVLGAFVAGVLVGESPILSQHIENQLRGLITAFMMPIFFGMSGLSADLTILKDPHLALLTLGLVAIASLGKFSGAFVGGKVSGLSSRESLALGCAMNARGSDGSDRRNHRPDDGCADAKHLHDDRHHGRHHHHGDAADAALGAAAIASGKGRTSQAREERISMPGDLSANLERLLIAADDSANGRFASKLAGFIAGQRGMPITVLHLSEKRVRRASPKDATTELKAVATEGAKDGHRAAQEETGRRAPRQGRSLGADRKDENV